MRTGWSPKVTNVLFRYIVVSKTNIYIYILIISLLCNYRNVGMLITLDAQVNKSKNLFVKKHYLRIK